jgi:gamma-glutamylcyclotransferase (GGCT)/AIG2-like uncharacterized protein YtfP
MSNIFFVYGTLRAGLRLHHFMKGAVYEGTATVRGTLYDVGTYPALHISQLVASGTAVCADSEIEVSGELYSGDDELLKVLDSVEDYFPGNPNSLYIRHLVDVTCTQDKDDNPVSQVRPAFLYIYNHDVSAMERIPGGDYKAYLQSKVIPMKVERDDA